PARSPLPVAALPSVSPIPSAPLTNSHKPDDPIGGNCCNSCLCLRFLCLFGCFVGRQVTCSEIIHANEFRFQIRLIRALPAVAPKAKAGNPWSKTFSR